MPPIEPPPIEPTIDPGTAVDPPPPAGTARPSFREAAGAFAKIGLLGFGGPAGQIALMHRILVEEKRWISEPRFLAALNYCMLLPGPEAQQLATYVGWRLHGTPGGLVAGTLFVLPGFLVILALSVVYALYQETATLAALFFGLKAAVLAIVVEAVVRVGRRALKSRLAVALAAAAFVAIFAFGVPFPLIILAAGLVGFTVARRRPELLIGAGSAAGDGAPDREEQPGERGWRRAGGLLALYGGLWIAPIVAVAVLLGTASVYPAIALFFSKMAVVTFGGAYAVLAYVAQQAVETHGWLRPGEMLDGLALAETTPGPLILVLTYVGFLAAFRDPGGLAPLAGGLLGAVLTTWVTFVPCFLWIFLGAPHVERLAGNRALAGALAAITAAVVGVILNLAVWFALHTLFGAVGTLALGPFAPPWPVWSTLDPVALALAAAAMLAMLRFGVGMLPTLALAAAAGLARGLLV